MSVIRVTKVMSNGIDKDFRPILLGIESIISCKPSINKAEPFRGTVKIESRGGMVETNYVLESIDEIEHLILIAEGRK